jgi:hypothetical protein
VYTENLTINLKLSLDNEADNTDDAEDSESSENNN